MSEMRSPVPLQLSLKRIEYSGFSMKPRNSTLREKNHEKSWDLKECRFYEIFERRKLEELGAYFEIIIRSDEAEVILYCNGGMRFGGYRQIDPSPKDESLLEIRCKILKEACKDVDLQWLPKGMRLEST